VLLVTVLGGWLCGCGVPSGGPPRPIATSEIPYGLVDPASASSGSSRPARPARLPSAPEIYFIDADERLRPLPFDAVGPPPRQALDPMLQSLVTGPDPDQRRRGLRTAFGQGTAVRLSSVTGDVAHVDLDLGDRPIGSELLPVAVGQVVLTATSVDGVRAVLLMSAGEPLPAPLPGGRLVDRPVTASDYVDLVATP
jgi:spore germination protein GerM